MGGEDDEDLVVVGNVYKVVMSRVENWIEWIRGVKWIIGVL